MSGRNIGRSEPRKGLPWPLRIFSSHSKQKERESQDQQKRDEINLTGQQKLIIIKSWQLLALELTSLGHKMMLEMFNKNLNTKILFEFALKIDTDLMHDVAFRTHAYRMVAAVCCFVENIDTPEETVADLFREIGEDHGKVKHYRLSFFEMLPEVYSKVWSEHLMDRYTKAAEKAWNEVFTYMTKMLIEGLMRGRGAARGSLASTSCVDPFSEKKPQSSTMMTRSETFQSLSPSLSSYSISDLSSVDSTTSTVAKARWKETLPLLAIPGWKTSPKSTPQEKTLVQQSDQSRSTASLFSQDFGTKEGYNPSLPRLIDDDSSASGPQSLFLGGSSEQTSKVPNAQSKV